MLSLNLNRLPVFRGLFKMQPTRTLASLLRWLAIAVLAMLAGTLFAFFPIVAELPSREECSVGEQRVV